jgi:cadmium resistance transport/sequestration family protein
MDLILTALLVGTSSFAATNIDDLVLLSLYFSQATTQQKRRAIVLGQYLGITVLVAVSLLTALTALVIPEEYIGLLGILPILLGVKQLLTSDTSHAVLLPAELPHSTSEIRQTFAGLLHPDIYSITAVTMANGSDNIAIYTPLFASASLLRLVLILLVFVGMLALWCLIAYKLVQQPLILQFLQRWGSVLMPFVLIGLGLSIMAESGTLAFLSRL